MRNPFEIVQNELEKKEEKRAPKHTEEFFDREKIKGKREEIKEEKRDIRNERDLRRELKKIEEEVLPKALSLKREVHWPGAAEAMEDVVKYLDEEVTTYKRMISRIESEKKEKKED